jgi:predicted glycosyltransferase
MIREEKITDKLSIIYYSAAPIDDDTLTSELAILGGLMFDAVSDTWKMDLATIPDGSVQTNNKHSTIRCAIVLYKEFNITKI